jgi:protein-tyrosine phosphatase
LIRNVYSNVLYVGNATDARDLRRLYDTSIRAVIDLALNEPPVQLGRDFIYCRYPLNDGEGNSDALVTLAIQTVVSLVRDEVPSLVACSAGMSRAPCIAAASVALLTGRAPDDCLLQLITDAPNDVSQILWAQVKRVYLEKA